MCTNPVGITGMLVPCGRCIACRIGRTSEWTTRILHELNYKDGCFVTLTYSNENEPAGRTLVKEHLQLFFKRLRKYLKPKRIKYFSCGEYGDEGERPHYHAIVMGWRPDLESCYKPNRKQLVSREIEKLWSFGYNTIGHPDREAIQYVVGYVRKKLYGVRAEEYGIRLAPFQLQSIGIGKEYAMEHKEQILSERGITRNGVNVGLPRYYRKKLIEKGSAEEFVYHERCKVKRDQLKYQYEDYHDYKDAYWSDNGRRKKQNEARESLFKKGSI